MIGPRRWAGLPILLLLAGPALGHGTATTGLLEQPVLVLDPGTHTARIWRADVDAEGRYAVTGSNDKTVRIWSIEDGRMLRTIRLPAGPGNVGRVFAVALSPDGEVIAAGGWTRWTDADQQEQIYVFDRGTGNMTGRIGGLPANVNHLKFSPDGRHLVAVLNTGGLRVYARDANWAEFRRDIDYGQSYRADFSADGRLATTSLDQMLRIYDRDFQLVAKVKTTGGRQPFGIAFSPDGAKLAIGYHDSTAVDLFDGRTLAPLPGPDTTGIDHGDLSRVAWSADGETLFAAGRYERYDESAPELSHFPLVAWSDAGLGTRRELPAGNDTITTLAPLADGSLLVATADPYLAVLDPEGHDRWARGYPKANFRNQHDVLAVSADGRMVDFGYEPWGETPARFNVTTLALSLNPPDDGSTARPKHHGLAIEGWWTTDHPTLDGEPLRLDGSEMSRSVAIHPDGKHFVLGTQFALRAYDANGEELWRNPAPGGVWAVNISGDGRLVVAAYGDGTIRWHRMDDGREPLAFLPLGDRKNWVAWTPEGFYGATPGAYGVLRWHVNRGWDQAGESMPVAEIPLLRRPRVMPIVLQEMETARALGVDDLQQAMRAVQLRTRSSVPPGARLHVLAIGVSDYGETAQHLRLKYAHQDADDIANALLSTQTSLYADVVLQVLRDRDATEDGIIRALATLRQGMAAGEPGRDLAVVHFSGHGAMIDDAFYLLPHGVDARDPVGIKGGALAIATLRDELHKVGEHGRVLVFLDACRSGAATADGAESAVNATALRTAVATANVTVLTSSEAGELSREDASWGNGAFTEALLDALRLADDDLNGLISVTELINYLANAVPRLTGNKQTPGIEARFESDVFVAGL